ncbi:DUF1508 domain-containing protein [Maribacter algicola]|uniref:DUF1508 domain-containing protein n=1 Tax=Meishania litoralis TaxID=3434685 RepID=A0ACC7LM18_9FLAO
MIEIKKYKRNGYTFSLKAEDGANLLSSVPFSSHEEVKKTVEQLQAVQNTQHVFERKTNHEGKFLFSVKGLDGRLIGKSELYTSEAGMENGIKNVRNRIASLTTL